MEPQAQACPLTKGEQMLVAVDGSKNSEFAVDQAISLGNMCNSTIYCISVVDVHPEVMSVAPDYVDQLTERARGYLDRAKHKVEEAGIRCETIIHTGASPHQFILDEAEKKEIDLIVMGTHGRSALRNIFMGSVAQKVVGSAPCPVMIIPGQD